jgi:WD40 repeat protein
MPTPVLPPGLTLRSTLAGGAPTLRRAAWSPDGRLLAIPSTEPALRLWNPEEGTVRTLADIPRCLGIESPAWSVAWSPDGSLLAAGLEHGAAVVWDLKAGTPLHRLAHSGSVTSLVFTPDGRRLATGSHRGRIYTWDLTSGERLSRIEAHPQGIAALAWQPVPGGRLASASLDHTIWLWCGSSGAPLVSLRGHGRAVLAVAWSPDGRTLASASADSTACLWDPESGALRERLSGHEGSVVGVSFSADGDLLASKSLDGTVRVWAGEPWREVAVLPESAAERSFFGTVAFHPRESLLATSGEKDTLLHLWDVDRDRLTGISQASLPVRNGVFISYSHSDREWLQRLKTMLAPYLRNGSITLWDDSKIKPGERWREEIELALAAVKVAVLLVSADFFASDFIADCELPAILEAAQARRLTVLCVHVSPCLWKETQIAEYQATHDPGRSLSQMDEWEQKQTLAEVCRRIKVAVG